MSSIKISIITVNRNNGKGLENTIRSVANQTYKHLEYLVIDGKSTDESVEVIRRYSDRVDFWCSEPDTGIYNAMNKGIAQAKGTYLLFLNSGDWLVDASVIENLAKNENGEVDLVYGNLQRTFPDGAGDYVEMPGFIDVETMMHWTLCHPVTLIHYRLFKDYGFYDERLKIVADWAFFFKVLLLGNATQRHKPVTVTNFIMDGMSSLVENQEKINKEREWVKNNYTSPTFRKFYQEYFVYRNFYHEKWSERLKKVKRAFHLFRH
ncbi:MAG: glycosyltransferase [Flavobacterium sp.]|nr:MAG: glycosyltransferase [Flavobacterium sp.]